MLKNIQKKQQLAIWSLILTISIILPSCEVIGGIFKAGVWTGIIVVVLIVALLIYIFSRFRRR